ncbi:MAG: hypothetical protein B6244_06295 [Candidatus Cloacimonetes bacterium 4572_55]|nr:MAG: hypothetical protein B6244_06295 [Candidatus Cloacimonetes bacterium 4572_55]
MAEKKIKDLTLWRWSYFLRSHSRESEKHKEEKHWKPICDIWFPAEEWLGKTKKTRDLISNRQTRHPLAIHGWTNLKDSDLQGSLGFYQMLDTYFIRTGCMRKAIVEPNKIADITSKECELSPELSSHSWLGSRACISALLINDTPYDTAKEIANDLLTSWPGKKKDFELLEMDWGHLAICSQEDIWLMLCYEDAKSKQLGENLIFSVLPSLFLAQAKNKDQMKKWEETLYPEIQGVEKDLDEQLNRIWPQTDCRREVKSLQKNALNKLEDATDTIACYQTQFAEKLSQGEELLKTMQINTNNIKSLLNDPCLVSQQARLNDLLIVEYQHQAGQVESDLAYMHITQTQSNRVLEGIDAMARVRSGRWERRTTILLGLFVALEIGQTFSEHWLKNPWERLGVIIFSACVIYLIMSRLSRK